MVEGFMIEAVLFDIGDTLLHFETSNARAFLDAATRPGYDCLRELGHRPPAYEAYLKIIKRSFQWAYVRSRVIRREVQIVQAFRRCHRRMGIELDDERVCDLGHRCTQALRRFLTVDDDAVDVAMRLRAAGFKLGLVSNTVFPGFAIDDFLAAERLLDHFPVRIYSSDVRYMKPHRAIFRMALDQLDVSPDRTLFIGDRMDKDVKGPSRMGMKTALVVRNGHVPHGRVRPDHIIQRLTEVTTLLKA